MLQFIPGETEAQGKLVDILKDTNKGTAKQEASNGIAQFWPHIRITWGK